MSRIAVVRRTADDACREELISYEMDAVVVACHVLLNMVGQCVTSSR
jgi:hypothetical protein